MEVRELARFRTFVWKLGYLVRKFWDLVWKFSYVVGDFELLVWKFMKIGLDFGNLVWKLGGKKSPLKNVSPKYVENLDLAKASCRAAT